MQHTTHTHVHNWYCSAHTFQSPLTDGLWSAGGGWGRGKGVLPPSSITTPSHHTTYDSDQILQYIYSIING